METMTFTGQLKIETCWCGIVHAVPQSLIDHAKRKQDAGEVISIYCPLGHAWVFAGKSRADRLFEQLQAAQSRTASAIAAHDQTRAALRDTEKRLSAQKGVTTRIKNRVGNGVCACCNRTFKDLAAHMKHKHPDYAKSE